MVRRQGWILPSAVSLSRLHLVQKGSETGVMTPKVRQGPGHHGYYQEHILQPLLVRESEAGFERLIQGG